jgi:hypothetical protein
MWRPRRPPQTAADHPGIALRCCLTDRADISVSAAGWQLSRNGGETGTHRYRSASAGRAINPGYQGCLTVAHGRITPLVRSCIGSNGADSQAPLTLTFPGNASAPIRRTGEERQRERPGQTTYCSWTICRRVSRRDRAEPSAGSWRPGAGLSEDPKRGGRHRVLGDGRAGGRWTGYRSCGQRACCSGDRRPRADRDHREAGWPKINRS